MTKKLQILRGTTAQNDAYTGSVGELTMDTEKVEVRIHDGTTQGGKTIGSSGGSVPDRYVESINGWTGNVFLGAHEIGTYTSDEIDNKILVINESIDAQTDAIADKADSDLKNTPLASLENNDGVLTWNGISMPAMGMPSSNSIQLTLGASGTSYTAPADGFVIFNKRANGTSQYIGISAEGWRDVDTLAYTAYEGCVFAPVKKGKNFTIDYAAGGELMQFRFVYAEGAKHLA